MVDIPLGSIRNGINDDFIAGSAREGQDSVHGLRHGTLELNRLSGRGRGEIIPGIGPGDLSRLSGAEGDRARSGGEAAVIVPAASNTDISSRLIRITGPDIEAFT